ncbi:PREDICTED: zinc finger protein CONSTANS-LIKE 7 [Theobroma cacao]|uniref:Zinc finger protein CONSTANS-LIKE 7 n=1 Tax=Theobroma cacao TaxID=3641 RepID=A0AB32V8M4_THECC|nr:PREDICTED: zinc finger protein CONSTANS-LIKE 7 [Theobroma cacao]
MCNKNSGSRRRRRKSKSSSVSLKASRKTRTKTRKPKYLSLLHLEENLPQMNLNTNTSSNNDNNKSNHQQQLNLFPLHPENLVEDKDTQYDNVCLLFNTTEEDNVHAVTLNGILDDESSDYKNETTTTTTTTTTTSDESPLSPSLTYGYSGEDHTRSLERSAMKGKKERDESEEKWVVYSEVVEKKEMEEVSSCDGGGGGDGGGDRGGAWCISSGSIISKKKMKKLLALKLDYQEIMNAWSDKGPLYIEGESPHTVPDLNDAAHVLGDVWGSVSDVWRVPEMVTNNVGSFKVKEEYEGKEDWRRGHREASVLRYKEKRRNRLFSKRIRYEVRKLNAEKRPRLKGRFVKRD